MKRRYNFSLRNIMISATILCAIMIIFTWETRDTISPVEKSVSYIIMPIYNGVNVFGDWVYDQVEFVRNINELEQINQEISQEIAQLRYENKILQQNKTELDRLRELYELDKRYADYPKIGAQVIGKDPSNWYNTFIINKGENHGLKVNMVVLAGNGLVGHIIEVGPNYAKVQTIINDTSNVSSKFLRTDDICVVKGDQTLVTDTAYCKVEYILDSAHIVIGDEVVTSHLGDIYPPGILIGSIKEIEENPHKMTKTAILEPVVDFKHLEEVLVINQVWEDVIN